MPGQQLVKALFGGQRPQRPPYIPLQGRVVEVLAQLDAPVYDANPQRQALALVETASALRADAVTVGIGASGDAGLDVARRVQPMLGGRALVAVLEQVDVALARSYCELGVDMLVLLLGCDELGSSRMRTLANACRFYQVPVVLAAPKAEDVLQRCRRSRAVRGAGDDGR